MSAPTQKDYVLLESSLSDKNLSSKLGISKDGKSIPIGNNIGDVTSFLFVLLVTTSLIGAVFMIMVGSFTRITTDSIYKKTEGNEKIRKAIYGLLAIFIMYLSILVVNPDMLKKNINFTDYSLTSNSSNPIFSDLITPSNTISNATGWPRPGQSGYQSNVDKFNANLSANQESAARASLVSIQSNNNQTSGVSVKRPNGCAKYLDVDCTNIAGLNTLKIVKFNMDCTNARKAKGSSIPCTTQITGGTEWWLHSPTTSHGPGSDTFDMSLSAGDETTQYIRSLPKGTTNKTCYATFIGSGYTFCDEINNNRHWHVTSN